MDPHWEVSVQDVKSMRSSGAAFFLLDVRQPDEYAICRIEGAYLVPLPDLPARIEEIRKLAAGRPIVAHCHHGGRSLQAAAILRKADLGNVKSMAGGIDAWSVLVDQQVPRY